ncbi:hypothetical protein YYC_00852 [Plasmodium yoelii 17X]|uniref:Uncharacterized protein n=1 Tax=Plasmodium yoelii 17X TaxID=1323249 RepID=V7PS28_PLAYE|nr:hypothetical protein YYC_00852 [Plasmodium yoelii 17X]
MIEFDELFELLKEIEISCDKFNEEDKEKEKIILFLNDLNSYISDISHSLKVKTNKISEIDILKKIISKKEKLENVLKNCNTKNEHEDTSSNNSPFINGAVILERNLSMGEKRMNTDQGKQDEEDEEGKRDESVLFLEKRDNPKKENSNDEQNNTLSHNYKVDNNNNNNNNSNFVKFENCELIKDSLIKEWGNQIDEYDNLKYEFTYEYKKIEFQKKLDKRKNTNTFKDDNIDDELCLLAQEMKENVLAYRQILVDDNKTLEVSATKQANNIDSILDVNKKTKKMGSNQSISFFLSLIIIAVSILLFIFTFFVIILL